MSFPLGEWLPVSSAVNLLAGLFLLSALSCFLIDEHRRASRQKRGGGEQPISLDDERLPV